MKINRLIDSFDDDSFVLYALQKRRLLEGIVLDYSFIRINPFNGINRKSHYVLMAEERVETGFLSFLMNSDLFSITNPDSKSVYFNRIILFPDEEYTFTLISGSYQTKEVTSKFKDLTDSNFFEDDKLIENLLKTKNIKVSMKLKNPSENRSTLEEKLALNNSDDHASILLSRFIQRVSNLQLEKDENIFKYFELLKIPYTDSETKEELVLKFKKINTSDLGIPKDILYMNVLFDSIGYRRDINKDFEKIINKTESSYKEIKEEMKVLEYKLRAKYITIKANNSI